MAHTHPIPGRLDRSTHEGPDDARDPLVDIGPIGPLGPLGPRRPGVSWWADTTDRVQDRWGVSVTPTRLVLTSLVLVALAVGGWWLLRPAGPPIDATLPRAGDGAQAIATGSGPAAGSGDSTVSVSGTPVGTSTSTSVPAAVVVQASGAVAHPGVYHLPGDARVDDLVRAAGGLTPDADADRVNLAGPVADGERVWVPRRGETEVPDVVAGAASGGAASDPGGGGSESGATPTPAGPVDLNTADAAALDTLPGVGPATAQSILAYRQEHGRFTAVDDLLEVRGIGDAKLEQLRLLVTV